MADDPFKEKLNPEQYRVMREGGTEAAYSGKYWQSDERGVYTCAACGKVLFLSFHKLESRDGWPSFGRPVTIKVLERLRSTDESSEKTESAEEVRCANCHSHLGYIVDETYGERYRINSIALDFQEAPEMDWDLTDEDKKKREEDEKKKQEEEAKAAQKPTKWKAWSKRVGVAGVGAFVGVMGYSVSRPAAPQCIPSSTATSTISAKTAPAAAPAAPTSASSATTSPVETAVATGTAATSSTASVGVI